MSINSIATIAPVVLDNVWKKDGTNVVRLRFTYQRDKKYLRTNIVVSVDSKVDFHQSGFKKGASGRPFQR